MLLLDLLLLLLPVHAEGRVREEVVEGFAPELVFGEVGKANLEEVWRENVILKALREGLPGRLEGICSRCLMKRRCLGSCIAQNFYSKGRLWAPYWFCEQAEEAGLFPPSRLGARPTPSPRLTIDNAGATA